MCDWNKEHMNAKGEKVKHGGRQNHAAHYLPEHMKRKHPEITYRTQKRQKACIDSENVDLSATQDAPMYDAFNDGFAPNQDVTMSDNFNDGSSADKKVGDDLDRVGSTKIDLGFFVESPSLVSNDFNDEVNLLIALGRS